MHKLSTAVTSLLIVFFLSSVASAQFVSTRGKQIVTPDGKSLALKGINLGNWLLPEGYMFKFKTASSPRLIQTVINELVGEDEARKFWKSHRDRYVTKEDIHFIKQSGFNSIRVPFSYRLFVSAEDPRKLEGEGYEILDRVVSWCKDENLYVILDMHAARAGLPGKAASAEWPRRLAAEFDRFVSRVDAGEDTLLDPYGAEAIEEFFAVAAEAFFVAAREFKLEEPALYELLVDFFRQTPADNHA